MFCRKALGRCYSTAADLPAHALWRQTFPTNSRFVLHRVSLANPNTAALVANAFVPKGSRDKIVIEAFPGPGQLTRALLALPRSRIKQLIVLESVESYLKYLKPLEALDSRIRVVDLGGELWTTYHTLDSMGLLKGLDTTPWDQIHPRLHFISHLQSNVSGEQLLSQLLRSIPDRQWLFKYGRIPMSFLLSESLWNRVTGDSLSVRCKLSMISAAVASSKHALPAKDLLPFSDNFHPIPSAHALAQRKSERAANKALVTGKTGNPYLAVNIEPLEDQAIAPGMLDKWDFCLRHLYVHRAKPLKAALPYLAPNAQTLLKGISDPDLPVDARLDPQTPVRKMTINDWGLLVKAFDEWPFAPEDLSVTDTVMLREEKSG
ncbi:S-adenosyl-L-methionine-dependent methyltransferase [Mycena amicta]|nr:S-adenosyl-L-methionine-dependent methyltransferase [Mycena amicta]